MNHDNIKFQDFIVVLFINSLFVWARDFTNKFSKI